MLPFQNRVIEEKKQLDERLEKLLEFVTSKLFQSLPIDEQRRLHRQSAAMCQYGDILAERIAAFRE